MNYITVKPGCRWSVVRVAGRTYTKDRRTPVATCDLNVELRRSPLLDIEMDATEGAVSLAEEYGVNLRYVQGDGRITKRDIALYVELREGGDYD